MTANPASATMELVKRLRSEYDSLISMSEWEEPILLEAADAIEALVAERDAAMKDADAGRALWAYMLENDIPWGEDQMIFVRMGLLKPVDMTTPESEGLGQCRNCDGDCDVCYRPTALLAAIIAQTRT